MAEPMLGNADRATFFSSVASMLSVGIQIDEAVYLLVDSSQDDLLKEVSLAVYQELLKGRPLSEALEHSGAFPTQTVSLVQAAEHTGHLDDTLRSLAEYAREEGRLIAKIRTSVTYPCVLLCIMSIILAFAVFAILPVFEGVYENMAGSLAASSFGAVQVGIVIGWIALVITLVVTLIALIAFIASRTEGGRAWLIRTLGTLPFAKSAFYELALARFTSVLSVYASAGQNLDDAVGHALETVENPALRLRVGTAHGSMLEPIRSSGLVQAFTAAQVLDPTELRMLSFGLRTGSIDEVLQEISSSLFNGAMDDLDALVDRVEPVLAGFVTIAVGATLIAVMLPLIGMMGAIG